MTPLNKQNDKTPNGVNPALDPQKERPGEDAEQPTNADYDYRPDFGKSGGAIEHNPELDDQSPKEPAQKPADKSEKD